MAGDWPGGGNTSDTKPASSTHKEASRVLLVIKLPPHHLKLPTPPGEERRGPLLYNTVGDFCG